MAFGVRREELNEWKRAVKAGNIAFLTHYWIHPKFPEYNTVTKVGCCNIDRLIEWGEKYRLKKEWIHFHPYPHFDLLGARQIEILKKEKIYEQIERFSLEKNRKEF